MSPSSSSSSSSSSGGSGGGGGGPSAVTLRVNLGVDPHGGGFPHNEYYNTRVWQSLEDFYLFRETHVYPFFHPEFRLVISNVQPRPQHSYIHSVVNAVIEQLNPRTRGPYGMDHSHQMLWFLSKGGLHARHNYVTEDIRFMAERVLSPFAHWAFRQTVLDYWVRSYIDGSPADHIRSLTPAGLIVFTICKLVVEGQHRGIWPRHELPICWRKVKL